MRTVCAGGGDGGGGPGGGGSNGGDGGSEEEAAGAVGVHEQDRAARDQPHVEEEREEEEAPLPFGQRQVEELCIEALAGGVADQPQHVQAEDGLDDHERDAEAVRDVVERLPQRLERAERQVEEQRRLGLVHRLARLLPHGGNRASDAAQAAEFRTASEQRPQSRAAFGIACARAYCHPDSDRFER